MKARSASIESPEKGVVEDGRRMGSPAYLGELLDEPLELGLLRG